MENVKTLKDLWDCYAEIKLPQLKAAKFDKLRWTKHVKPTLGDHLLKDIKGIEVMRLRNVLEKKGLSPQTVHHCLALLRRILKKGMQWEIYPGPLPYFEMPQVKNARTRFLRKDEAKVLLAEIKKRSDLWHDISLLALLSGLRACEIYTLKVSHVDLANGFVNIYDGKTINRSVPLCPAAKVLIAPYCNKPAGALVFQNSEGKVIREVSNTFPRSVASCRMNDGATDRRDKVVFHTLRHTFASWLVQNGTPLATVSHILGHSSIDMTMRYVHLSPEHGHKAVADLW